MTSAASEPRESLLGAPAPVAILTFDAEGQCSFADPRWVALTGCEPADCQGDGWLKAFHPAHRRLLKTAWRRAVGSTSPLDHECRLHDTDARARRVRLLSTPQIGPHGLLQNHLMVALDVTASHQREQQHAEVVHQLQERVKELTLLQQVASLLREPHESIWGLIDELVQLLPSGWQFPSLARVRICYGASYRASPGFCLSPWMQQAEFRTSDGTIGRIEIAYGQVPCAGEQPFLPEEQNVLGTVADALRAHLDRRLAEQRSEVQESRLQALLRNLPGAVYRCAIDEDWTMHYLSEGVQHITGYPACDFINNARRSFADIIDADDNARNTILVDDAVKRRKPFQMEYRLRHADGSTRWIYEHGQAAYDDDGKPVWLDGAVFDMTPLKLAEQHHEERSSLRRAIEAQEQVLSVVSHELRTPLAAARALSEMLLTDHEFEGQPRQFVESIHDQVLRMCAMVNDLLEAARLNSGTARWNWGEFDLNEVCAGALQSVKPLANPLNVELRLSADSQPILMKGDRSAVHRLVVNLLTNAIKATPEGWIEVAAAAFNERGQPWARIIVRDTGKGMDTRTAAKLGEAFVLNSGVVGAMQVEGVGLGLAICKGIVAAHGGLMSVVSVPHRGTSVTANLRSDLDHPIGEDRGGEVLHVVDDDEDSPSG